MRRPSEFRSSSLYLPTNCSRIKSTKYGATGFNILRSKLERSRLSGISLGLRNGAGFNHGFKNEIATVKSALWMTVRREIAWSLDQTRQHSRFWERDVFQVLAEVRLRRLTEAGDGE